MKPITIALPKVIPVLRDGVDQRIKTNVQEFNMYFENIILPYRQEYDVQVKCNYGRNFGKFWRLSEYPKDVDSFDFELVIYDEYGEKVASAKTVFELYDRSEYDEDYNMLFIGDSMTFGQMYLERISANLINIVFKGSRNRYGHISHEGRGGWSYASYYNRCFNSGGISPFMFPKDVDNYMGDINFINIVNNPEHPAYSYDGFEKQTFMEGCVYGKEGHLYTYENGEFVLLEKEPQWEYNFTKYMKRHNMGKVDAVSILMGANDLQFTTYENSDEGIEKYIANTEKFINGIKEYDPTIKIMINMPPIGAEQYAWGTQLGCKGSSKMYRFNIIKAGKAIIDKWSGKEDEGIYISPVLLCIDPEHGFSKSVYKATKYSESQETHHNNWVHPYLAGYQQIGDAMCGPIQKMRKDI